MLDTFRSTPLPGDFNYNIGLASVEKSVYIFIMLWTPLLLLSYPLALIASPLSERSPLVHGDISTSDASAIVEREANVSPVKRLLKRADTVFNALGTFGPLGLLGSIDANGNAVAATSNGDNDDNPADQPTFVSGTARAFINAIVRIQKLTLVGLC